MNHGKFIISLDFELMWGVRDKKNMSSYGNEILGVHTVIPKLLQLFNVYNINGTFSIVGFLFFNSKEELLDHIPTFVPNYSDPNLSPYNGYIHNLEDDVVNDVYHFAPNLIDEIKKSPGQEIGTHTFSHYYCLEANQTIEEFRADITNAIIAANKFNTKLTSLIFPRNQYNKEYIKVCNELGIICYRGNESSWLYSAKNGKEDTLIRRAFRLIDAYINISGHNCSTQSLNQKLPINIPSSRFLRPYSKKLRFIEKFRFLRIKRGMTYAAKNNLTYHLWWHPHNFGVNQEENFKFLEKVLNHYQFLNSKYNFKSYTMSGLVNNLFEKK